MKKLLLLSIFAFSISSNSQTVLFEENFDAYDDFIIDGIGDWTNTDVDLRNTYGFQGVTFANTGVAKSFQIFNSTTTAPPLTPSATSDWSARSGQKAAVCFAAVPGAGINANNDWLISPQIQLAASGNTLTFWAKSCDTGFGLEKFKVGVSTTNNQTASFTFITPAPHVVNPATAQWVEYTYSLDAYQGQNVFIAINCVSDDQFGFAIDDFQVTTTLSTQDFFANNLKVYPNPTKDILNLSSSTTLINSVEVTDLNGRIVKSFNLNGIAQTELNVSDLTSGMYFVSVETDLGIGSTKIVKN
ncbi:MAG TPA: choice-of-anchor J domain-containing protein [Flavobacterium sp.]|uniref:T9SS-dependent choice-of-anchor J family protein n=1 Tax=unclassified Flavobacterium TaxID=196869 RepID=UPI0025BCC790|nr:MULTISPECIES: choice-of-anchor J domain-containing protein [unclassified Flavobacterium]HRE77419.1 choice-of-anchor J domain-containing protein [Flavobacterium sp.]